jgi:hypothetical protein
LIENLLNWILTILQEEVDPMTIVEISDRMDHELQKAKPLLDVILSLDPRFQRVGAESWKTTEVASTPSTFERNELVDSSKIIQTAIKFREQAISILLDERSDLTEYIERTNERLQEINGLLANLDYIAESSYSRRASRGTAEKAATAGQRKEDSRYRSVWPLPGGKEYLLENVTIILEHLAENHMDLESLLEWFQNYFDIGNWAKHSLVSCIIYPGFAERKGDIVQITDLGRKFLKNQDLELVAEAARRSFWGIDEMIGWLTNQPMTIKQLHERFNMLGAGWKKTGQVKYRINWLLACNLIEVVPGIHPIQYQIARSS